MQQWASVAASTAALIVLLLGLVRAWDVWSVLERAVLAYLVVFGIVGGLLLLGRTALRSEPSPSTESTGRNGEGRRTDGTDAAL